MEVIQIIGLFFFTIVLFLSARVQSYDAMSIFLLAGQSNMVGKGGLHFVNTSFVWDEFVPLECQPDSKILRLNNRSQWEVAREPLHLGIQPNVGFGVGPGLPFATSILDPLQETIGLVPCAVGGSNISQWQRGMPFYDRALTRARAAVSYARGGVIRALLWYQGEADTNNEQTAIAYKGRLVQLFNDLREDLESPYLPIIQVALANRGTGAYRETVREAQLNTGLPNVFCVDADKLNVTIQNDTLNIHLDTPTQVKLGKALATVFLNISTASLL